MCKKYIELGAVQRLIQYELNELDAFEHFSHMQLPKVSKESFIDLQERIEELPTIEVENGVCKSK